MNVSPGPRVAYLVTSHRDISQLARLVRTIRASDSTGRIYIDHDRAGEPGVEALAEPGTVHVQLSTGGRGDDTQILRQLDLGAAVARDGGTDYVVFLSGEDYPCRPLEQMKALLTTSPDGFLHHFPVLDRRRSEWRVREGRLRYRYRWSQGWAISPRWRDRLHFLHGLNYLQPLIGVHLSYGRLRLGHRRCGPLPGVELYGGSNWCSLSWQAFQHARRTIGSSPALQGWMRQSVAIDEAIYPSVLISSGAFTFEPTNHRYFDFRGTSFGHPAYLTGEHLADIERSGAFFARKVDRTLSAALMDRLDARVLRETPTPTGAR